MSQPQTQAPQAFAALHVASFRRYFPLCLLSMVGDNIEHVISYWVMFQLFHSPALAGFAVISHWVPFLLFSMYTGALADRYDCRKLIQISQVLYVVASLSWGALFLAGTLEMWHAVVILTVHGAAGVLAAPAQQLMVHDMVPREQLPSAIRLFASSRYLSILLGPAIGGGLMLAFGPAWGLFANALIYLPFSLFLFRVPYSGHSGRQQGEGRSKSFRIADVLDVFATAGTEPRIVTMIILAGASSFFVGNAFQAQMPEYAQQFGADDTGARYTVLMAANAAGAVLGVILLESATLLQPTPRTAIVCAALWAIAMGLFPMTGNYLTAVTLLVVAGVFSIAFTSVAQTVVQLLAPSRIRGSVVGLFNTAMLGLRAGAGVTVGVAGEFIGPRRSLEISSLMVLLVTLALFARDARAGAAPPLVTDRESV